MKKLLLIISLLSIAQAYALTQADQDLITAVKSNSYDQIFPAFRDGADINAQDEQGMTALHWAAKSDSEDMVFNLMITASAEVPCTIDFSIQDDRGRTVLHYCAAEHDEYVACEIIDLYKDSIPLNNGTLNVNAQDENGQTALHIAAKKGHVNLIDELLDYSTINPEIRDVWGNTAEDIAEGGAFLCFIDNDNDYDNLDSLKDAVKCGSIEKVTHLLNQLKDSHKRDFYVGIALSLAIMIRNHSLVEVLINQGADPYVVSDYINMNIILAGNRLDIAILRLLLKNIAGISQETLNSALTMAVGEATHHPLEDLPKTPACLRSTNTKAFLFVLMAIGVDDDSFRKPTCPHGKKITLCTPCIEEFLTVLLEYGADPFGIVKMSKDHFTTAYQLAKESGDMALIKLLEKYK